MEQQNSLDLFQEQQKYIKGTHLVTIFHNEKNLYSVVRVRVQDTNEEYTEREAVVTGYFPRIHEDEVYIFFGALKEHPKFGLQFHVEHFRKELPQSKQGIIQYLSGDLFKGIGKKTAENIVETLGESAISKILENPTVLSKIPKLSDEKAKEIYKSLIEHQGLEQIMIGLSQYGFGPQLSMKIYQTYKDQTLEIIQENPYKMVEDVEGIGFGRADELGHVLGISGNHSDRIRAGCLYILEQDSIQEGHVYLLQAQLLHKVKHLLEENKRDVISEFDISREITCLAEEGKLIIEEERVYVPSLFYSEKGLVTNITRILEQTEYADSFPESEFLLALGKLEERLKVEYAPSQKQAIQNALMSPMLLLTGGPGTGKTTVIKGIVELYGELHGCSLEPKDYNDENPFPILLVAPTGRAAKRMSEATGLPAVTIHRLLGWNGVEGFVHDEDNQINGKLLIVDEVSMVDIWLANQLFKSLPPSMQVLLVGDEDQLPSVGPGQVLKDLLASKVIPTVLLTDIYRQAQGSSIIDLAHDIKTGGLPPDITNPKPDRSFIKCSQTQVLDVVRKVSQNAKEKGYSARDIQVLAPMYRGSAGIDQLNIMLQDMFNPKSDQKREMQFGDSIYRVGDKVLQLVNQPESNVFNGDIGEIVSIFYAKENTEKQDLIVISFDGNEATYTKQELTQITHAYCCSIHKSQGSEFPIVILPIVKSYYRMLRRNLIYTAITRSKNFLILCGEEEALRQGIRRNDDGLRQTTLATKLQHDLKAPLEKLVIPTDAESGVDVVPFMRDANIGMENLSPYDFMDESER
ncbi:ATP-dependent RecD-like DNA helicase [Cytobacillus sp. S13-E01]|uniref:SF1B family DNA helicase RecD2 n=1 Tax=Cytobacillus sp. S13-E01 TaxID=3031326 RepID=UPI0023D83384|nr:ATP-dependent RecD-like DNA helicase [Cytobacillus sp. S13-E01]MDF0726819.1 ATP-dependent RecD-like DNA helicase [Cytobacillus sp. S13-E01]